MGGLPDPLRHPDLEVIGRRLRQQLYETLDAEQAAAREAAIRRRGLRDRMLEAADRQEHAVVSCTDGEIHRGLVTAVGIDHVVLRDGPADRFITLQHVVSVVYR